METILINNPFTKIYITKLRDKNTSKSDFSASLSYLAKALVYEASKDFQFESKEILTPVAEYRGAQLKEKIIFIPILRAGLGMLAPALSVIPQASAGFLGMHRDENNFLPQDFWVAMPDNLSDYKVIVLDPMVATGGSLIYALQHLTELGAKNITCLSIIGSIEGVEKIKGSNLCDKLFLIEVDEKLNEEKFIVPGLGDAGDRLFGSR